jgi:hypothetical protein
MHGFKSCLVFLSVAILSACATTPIPGGQADHVPSNRQVALGEAGPGTVPVVITRDAGLMSRACSTRVYVNGDLAVYVRAGEKVTLHLPAGDAILGAQPDGICAGGLVEIEARLQTGRSYQYRIGYDHNGSIGLYRTVAR